jgi:GH43 family beta-xylosidase
MTYSASATDANYRMGLLVADENANLLDAVSWTKSPRPVLASYAPHDRFAPAFPQDTPSRKHGRNRAPQAGLTG